MAHADTASPAAGEGEVPWQGARPEQICEAIANCWAEWEEDRAGKGVYTAEELAEDSGEFATTLYDALATLRPSPDAIREAMLAEALEERPSDEDLGAYLPEFVHGEKRCGIERSVWLPGWYVPWSPRNDNQNAEGPWSHWVSLAHEIIDADAKARTALGRTTDKGEG